MKMLSQKTKRYSFVAAATLFGLICLTSERNTKPQTQQSEMADKKSIKSQSVSYGNQNITFEEKKKTESLSGLVDELKQTFQYESFNCKLIPRLKPKVRELAKKDDNLSENLVDIFSSVGTVSNNNLGNLTRILNDQIDLVSTEDIARSPLALRVNQAAKEGKIAELIDSLGFFDTLKTTFPRSADGPIITPSNLLSAYFIESVQMNDLEFDPNCLSQLLHQLRLSSLIRWHLANYLMLNPDKASSVLDKISEDQIDGILSNAAYDLFEQATNLKNFEIFFDSLSPQMQQKIGKKFREANILSENLQILIREVRSERLRAALSEFNDKKFSQENENNEADESVEHDMTDENK